MPNIPRRFSVVQCAEAAAAIHDDVHKLVQGLSESQFHAPGRDGGWSIGFCLEHLILTGQAMLPRWDAGIERTVPDGRGLSRDYSLLERLFLYYMEPPYRLKTNTAEWAVPNTRRSIESTLGRFGQTQRAMLERLERCAPHSVSRVTSPYVSWISYRMDFSFEIMLAHSRRHVWQAWQRRKLFIETKGSAVTLTP